MSCNKIQQVKKNKKTPIAAANTSKPIPYNKRNHSKNKLVKEDIEFLKKYNMYDILDIQVKKGMI